ncbi:hypothetical protein HYZ97_04400 [Candidatus Pacearchaeota archaeon]|nr:hypothetical protein [Candidatus Pacearchaeota archaeon]
MIKDKYLRERGGTAKIINISCMKCGKLLLVYQKDGPGWLKRCYLNRILSPERYSRLEKNKSITKSSDFNNLVCDCGEVIGSPIQYKDSRLAFHLIRGKFKRSNNKAGEWK